MFHMLKTMFPVLRFVPVVSWSLSALAISAGFAVHDLQSASAVDWLMFGVILTSALLLQGVVVRTVQERGEAAGDKKSVNQKGRLVLGLLALVGTVTFGIYAAKTATGSLTLFLLVGVWTTLSYTCHPFRFLPMLGEWYAAFPAIVLCTLGTYFILTDTWEPIVGWASVLHSLLCVAWLMQYHLGDLTTDRRKKEERHTTVAWAAKKFGLEAARHVPATYFLLTAFVGTLATLQVAHVFLLTVVCALLGAFNSWNTNTRNVRQIAGNQLKMILMTVLHAMFLALWVANT